MRAIVVYYSLEGHTQYIAEEIAQCLKADTLALKIAKPYPKGKMARMFWCGKAAVFGEKPKLAPYEFDTSQYDLVILGTPIWAGSHAAPISTFLEENNIGGHKVAIYVCSGGGGTQKCFNQLENKWGEAIATLSLINPNKQTYAEDRSKVEAFCKAIQESI